MTRQFDLAAYLNRIRHHGPLDRSLDGLKALQASHLDAIPFEAIDVALGRGVDLAPEAVDAKLIGARRGGYCYEQNGLFKRALTALGFNVEGLLFRVRMGRKPGDPPMARSHMALRVRLDGEDFLVDVGFGGMVPPEPLRLAEEGPQQTAHERWRLTRRDGLRLAEAEVEGEWAPMYEIYEEPQADVDYEPANWFTSTHPSSFFRQALVAARVMADARYALFGARLTVRRGGRTIDRHDLTRPELEKSLHDTFGLEPQPGWRPLLERAAASA